MEIELVKFLKKDKSFYNILIKIKEKYESFGKFTGKIKKNELSIIELNSLSRLTGENYNIGKNYILIKDIVESFERTKFSGIDFKRVLELFFREDIIYKKEEKSNYEIQLSGFFSKLIDWHRNSDGGNFLQSAFSGEKGHLLLMKEYNHYYNENRLNEFEIIIEKVISSINKLPYRSENIKLLPIFSTEVSGDPHFLDICNFSGRLFLYGLSFCFNTKFPQNSEARIDLYYRAGLAVDDISNNVAITGIIAEKNGLIHQGWSGFFNLKEHFLVPMSGIINVDKIISKKKVILVIENPAVFMEIAEYYKNIKDENISIVCGYGNIKTTVLYLLDLAVKSGIKILYSGDLDPEGLIIAEKLKNRYNEYIELVGFNVENYRNNLSEVKISENSIKKLNKIQLKEFCELKKIIEINRQKVFQESFIKLIIKEYEELIK